MSAGGYAMKAKNLMLLWDDHAINILAVEHRSKVPYPQRHCGGACYSDWRGDSRDFANLFSEIVDLWGAEPVVVLRELAKASDCPYWIRHLLDGFTWSDQ